MLRPLIPGLCLLISSAALYAQPQAPPEPLHRTLSFNGEEREYFLHIPENQDPEHTYWLLVFAHGGGGDPHRHLGGVKYWSDKLKLDAIIVAPRFITEGRIQYWFPSLGEGAFLKAVIKDLDGQYRLHPKILLSGYSAGGQFAHRFAFQNPHLIHACAPLAAGSWTTPDGRFFIFELGEIEEPQTYLMKPPPDFKESVARKLFFQEEVTRVAGIRARPEAARIPFLVMCGKLDPRLPIVEAFSKSLIDAGFHCETGWPRTDHAPDDETQEEYQNFYRRTIEFFVSLVTPPGQD